jgi:hypothetical protein
MSAVDGEILETTAAQSTISAHLADEFAPAFPQQLEDLDVSAGFLADLALKSVSLEAESTTGGVAARLHLGILVTERLLLRLVQERLIETKGLVGPYNHRYGMLDHGWGKVDRLMSQSSYVVDAEKASHSTAGRRSVTREDAESVVAPSSNPDKRKPAGAFAG